MNRRWAHGVAIYMLGKLQEGIGRMINNRNHQSSGFGKQIAGKVGMAIGENQETIKRRTRNR